MEEEKKYLLSCCGVETFSQTFNEEIANQSPEDYVLTLVKKFSPTAVVCGFNHRFGKNALGDYSTLLELGKKYNFQVRAIPPVYSEGTLVSSTNIRNAILSGEIEKAKKTTVETVKDLSRHTFYIDRVRSQQNLQNCLMHPSQISKSHVHRHRRRHEHEYNHQGYQQSR